LSISGSKLYQLFKYAVYAFLTANIFFFYAEESAAAPLQFPGGVGLHNIREAYAATIDTLAWVILLYMFELETYILEDRHFTPTVTVSLRALRALAYVAIVMAFLGYVADMRFVSHVVPLAGVSDLCQLPANEWQWQYIFGEYMPITTANCATLSEASSFLRYGELPLLADAAQHVENLRLAWADVINGGTWILVVVILEIDVWLQERHRFEGIALHLSNACKFVLYATLLLVAVYWTFNGDLLDTWDAYMWLIAFVFIELNVFEWRAEDHAAEAAAGKDQELVS
jgi:hypothetical protein